MGFGFLAPWLASLAFYFDFSQAWQKITLDARCLSSIGILFVAEVAYIGWRESSLGVLVKPKRTDWCDLISYFIWVVNIRKILSNVFLLGLVVFIDRDMHSYGSSHGLLGGIPLWVRLPLAILLQDFLIYWSHRLKHECPFVWPVHEFHHSSTKLSLFTNYRVHPLDYPISALTVFLPVFFLFGTDLDGIFLFFFLSYFTGYFNHSRFDFDLGWVGRWVFVGPRFHYVHHSFVGSKRANYGELLVIWDRLFGTYVKPCETIKSVTTGICETTLREDQTVRAFFMSVWNFYWLPLKALKSAFGAVRAGEAREKSAR